jgi:RNA polymerase sigma-70 factor (ECF subfamily)
VLSLEDTARAAARGDSAAQQRLTTAISPLVTRQLGRYPLSPEDRSDVLQNALLRVHERIGSFRGDSSFTTWLFRLTANEALMLMRRHRWQRERFVHAEMDDDLAASFETDVDAELDGHHVREALDALPAHYRSVVELYYAEERPLGEIATSLSTTESTVRSRLHRARSELRRRLSGLETVAAAL